MPMSNVVKAQWEGIKNQVELADVSGAYSLNDNIRVNISAIKHFIVNSIDIDRAIATVITKIENLAAVCAEHRSTAYQNGTFRAARASALEAVGQLGATLDQSEMNDRSKALDLD